MTARAADNPDHGLFLASGCVPDGQHGRFRRGLAGRFRDGRNVAVDYRWADGRVEGCASSRRISYATGRSLLLEAPQASGCRGRKKTMPIVFDRARSGRERAG
jgi:hypothetical protein